MSVNPSTTGIPSTQLPPSKSSKRDFEQSQLYENSINVLFLQETYRGGYKPQTKNQRPHYQYDSEVFIRHHIKVSSLVLRCGNNIEVLTMETRSCTVTSFINHQLLLSRRRTIFILN